MRGAVSGGSFVDFEVGVGEEGGETRVGEDVCAFVVGDVGFSIGSIGGRVGVHVAVCICCRHGIIILCSICKLASLGNRTLRFSPLVLLFPLEHALGEAFVHLDRHFFDAADAAFALFVDALLDALLAAFDP